MENNKLRFGNLITFESLTKNDTQILLGRSGTLEVIAWDTGDYVWKVNSDIIGEDCPNFIECLHEKIEGQVNISDETLNDLKNALRIDFQNSLKILNAALEDAVNLFKNRTFLKMKSDDKDSDLSGLKTEKQHIDNGIKSSVFSEFGLDNSQLVSTSESFQQIIKSFELFQEYQKEFERISMKLNDIPYENEETKKYKNNLKHNISLLDQGQMFNGEELQEDFRMDKEQVIKVMSKEYSGFSDMIQDLG